jgi:hypothetical protein
MPMICKFCRSPQRATLERELANGASYRDIASKLDIDMASVSRHVNKCIPGKIAKATEKRDISDGINAIDALTEHYEIVREWLRHAIESGKIAEIALMLKESRKSIELSGRLSGELNGSTTQINMLNPEFVWLRDTVINSLEPEDRLRLSAKLRDIAELER